MQSSRNSFHACMEAEWQAFCERVDRCMERAKYLFARQESAAEPAKLMMELLARGNSFSMLQKVRENDLDVDSKTDWLAPPLEFPAHEFMETNTAFCAEAFPQVGCPFQTFLANTFQMHLPCFTSYSSYPAGTSRVDARQARFPTERLQ